MEPALLWPLGYFNSELTPGTNFNISLKDTCLKTHTTPKQTIKRGMQCPEWLFVDECQISK